MNNREAMVIIYNSTVSREISRTKFTSCNFIATQPNTREIYLVFHSYPCYYIYIYTYVYIPTYISDFHL